MTVKLLLLAIASTPAITQDQAANSGNGGSGGDLSGCRFPCSVIK